MQSLQGKFLVASPHLLDPNFFRSVVLIVQHDSDGAFGVILNRPTANTVGEVWQMVADEPCASSEFVFHGGPVEGPLVAIHGADTNADNEVIPGVYFAADRDGIRSMIRESQPMLRIFAGYAGWAKGQLESELEAGGWLVADATADDVFGDEEEIWDIIVKRIGLQILGPSLRSKHIPDNPAAN